MFLVVLSNSYVCELRCYLLYSRMSSLLVPKTAPTSPTPVKYSRTSYDSDKKSLDVGHLSVSHQDMKWKREEKRVYDTPEVVYLGQVVGSVRRSQKIKKRRDSPVPVPEKVKEDVKEQPSNSDEDVRFLKEVSPRDRVSRRYKR